jgi:putative tryptophan/tyrosine transport system substrate-binding protein
MRSTFKSLMALALVAVLSALVVAAGGCGSSNSSSNGASASAAPTKTYKIGITQIVTHPALDAAVAGFKEELAAKGFVEGKNVTFDFQNAQGDMPTTVTIAQKFAGESLNLVYTVATPSSQAMVKAITTTPIVFCAVTDPVGAGLVKDAAAPDANVTGVSDMLPVQPHLDLIKQLVPNVKTIGVLYNAGEANSVFLIKAEKAAAAAMGIKVIDATAATPADVQVAAQSLIGRVDAISVLTDNTVVSALASVVKVCDQNKIPLIAGDTDSVKGGAVAAYAFDYKDLGKQAGDIAANILNGTAVKDIPVEFAKNLQLSINETAAKAMGVTIPADLLAKAVNKF